MENLNSVIPQILDSSCLPSQISEPPDVGNWFSSYVYESFVLDTNDDVKESVYEESECEKERFSLGESQREQENMAEQREAVSSGGIDVEQEMVSSEFVKNKGSFGYDENVNESSSKKPDSLDSPSAFTEAPDVKNWFSSYVYESPELGTSNEFGDSLVQELEKNESAEHIEKEQKKMIIRDDGNRDEQVDVEERSITFGNGNSFLGVNEQVNWSENKGNDIDENEQKESPFSQNNFNPVKFPEEAIEDSTLRNNVIIPSKSDKESSFCAEDSMSKWEKKHSQEVPFVPLKISTNPLCDKTKSPTRLLHTTDSKAEKPIGASPRKQQAHGMIDKENEGEETVENGFVTTRKNRCTVTGHEGSWKRPGGTLQESSRNKDSLNLPTGERDGFLKRKALTEVTNIQHSNAMEGVTGKWRCPQKSKPNRGPPLKQLRLERWVQRL